MSGKISLPALLGASVISGITGTFVYFYLRSKLEESRRKLDEITTLHLEIPRETAAVIIGREGENVNSIESKTTTTISFIDPGGPLRLCVIRGKKDNVAAAQELVLTIVKEHALLETVEIHISQRVLASLTAQNNEKMKMISRATSTRICVERTLGKTPSLLVRGTNEQVEDVRDWLKRLAAEEEMLEKELQKCVANRTHKKILPRDASSITDLQGGKGVLEDFIATSPDGFIEVFVSAVKDPFNFWVQRVGPQSIELDRLVENMTEYYSEDKNRMLHMLSKVETGGLVAALFPHDNCWYRGKILSFKLDTYQREASEVFVEFVDFGDKESIQLKNICSIRSDFLSLRFQAIRCRLAQVAPIGTDWDENAIEAFELLTYCAQWKLIMAHIESHHRCDDELVPSVKLLDTNGDKDIDIAVELVQRNLASWKSNKSGLLKLK